MATLERKHELCGLITQRRHPLVKTSAEIISEARQSLHIKSTQRPFTPTGEHRQLFGKNTVHGKNDNRPPSSFSLHAQNFDAPESRPGSHSHHSTRDQCQRPHISDPCNVKNPFKACPKRPTRPLEADIRLAGTQSHSTRVETLTMPLPFGRQTNEVKRESGSWDQKQSSAKGQPRTDHVAVHSGPHKPGPHRTASESRILQPGDDSGARPTERRSRQKTEMGNRDDAIGTGEDAESLMWQNTIVPLLQQMQSVAAAGNSLGSVDHLCNLCDSLHSTLEKAGMLGQCGKRRSVILQTLFHLVDLNSDQLNLHIAKLCLSLSVSGNNLHNICKLIFQSSRNERNDILFQNKSMIEMFLSIFSNKDVLSSAKALLYCVGALKFLSGNSSIVKFLLGNNCIGVAQKLLKRLCTGENYNVTEAGQILVQLTVTLRNFADHPDSRQLFIAFSIISDLCLALRLYIQDQDICTNISRIYSKLSTYSVCRRALAQTPDCYQLFLEVLSKHHQKQDLVVRFLFTLVNLTAKFDEARQQLFRCEGCTDTLLRLYDSYQRRDDGKPPAPAARVEEDEDVLVKLVSVLANMCIHPAVGPTLAANRTCTELLLETLALRSMQDSKELVISVAAAINSLSFYQVETSGPRNSRLAIAMLMKKLLLSCDMDVMLEATRVFGNLAQSKDVRDFIVQSKVHQVLLALLDSKSTDMCYSACGVLINLTLDPPNRVTLSREGAASKLLDCLRDLGPGDWQLAGQVCQALWNLIGGGREKLLHRKERELLLQTLITYLDKEEAACWIENEEMRDYHEACWEAQFQPVAQKLVRILQLPAGTA